MRTRLVFVLPALLMLLGSAADAGDYILLKGDLHCHSNFSSDSDVPPEQVIADSVTAGYDFISLTEHDTKYHLRKDHSTAELIVLPGYEMTLRGGHYNVFGIREFRVRGDLVRSELGDHIAYLKGLGAFVQLDHPNDAKYGSKYGYEFDFELLEVLNGKPTADDYRTIADYQTLLCTGRKIVATTGTDAHRNHTVRRNFNCVLATARTSEAILEGIRAGRLYIAVTVDGPVISMTCGDAVMGATVARKDGLTVDIAISGLPAGSSVRVHTSVGLAGETAAEGDFGISVPTAGCSFVRCEVWQDGSILALSNPIYIE